MMIKNRMKTWLPCLVLTIGLAGCYDEMDSKASVDAQYETSNAPTVEVASTTVIDFSSFSATGSVSSVENVLEVGLQVSANEDFSNATVYPAAEVSTSFSATTKDLKDNTTYYVRAYAYTRSAGTAFSAAKTATLPKAPEFQDTYLFGTYMTEDYNLDSGEVEGEPYPVKIAQLNGLWNKVSITNIWAGGKTIEATVDFEQKTITTALNSVIYVDSDYGNVYAWGMSVANGKLVKNSECITVATYDENGNISFYWGAICDAGAFGYYKTTLVKQ